MEKVEIALQQLSDSANLYTKGNFASAITLAGAAEEILGKICKKRTGKNHLEGAIIFLDGVYRFFEHSPPHEKELRNRILRPKNELKHNDSGENTWIDADFENECTLIFVRAVKNYYDSYGKLPENENISGLFDHLTL